MRIKLQKKKKRCERKNTKYKQSKIYVMLVRYCGLAKEEILEHLKAAPEENPACRPIFLNRIKEQIFKTIEIRAHCMLTCMYGREIHFESLLENLLRKPLGLCSALWLIVLSYYSNFKKKHHNRELKFWKMHFLRMTN